MLSGVLPLSDDHIDLINQLNAGLADLAEQRGLKYVDANTTMLNEDGRFKASVADRRMRLKGAGYSAWKELLSPHL